MDRELLQTELKALVTQCIDADQTNNIPELMRIYIKDKYLAQGADVDTEHLDIDFDLKPSPDITIDLASVTILYGNLYTFVLCQCVCVPYYEWIYEDIFETEYFVFSRRIYSEFTDGTKKSSYSVKNKQTNQIQTYNGKVVD